MIKRRLELSRDEVLAYSNNVVEKIKKLDFYNVDMTLGLYMPINNEIEVNLDNKNVCYPKIIGDDILFFKPDGFTPGIFNILEPNGELVDKKTIDLIIVPLLYFDKYNNRVGYGKGYYDRFLSDYNGITVGVAYDFQEVDKIDVKPTDIKLDYIIKGELK